jgi:hypothetical protein
MVGVASVDEHFRSIRLPISFDDYLRLPQNSAYKYEYIEGCALLTPRPKCFRAALDLQPITDVEAVEVRPLPPAEVPGFAELFRGAFARTQPFASLDDDAALAAARACLARTQRGDDGPLIERACFQSFDRRHEGPTGAILVTLLPEAFLHDLWCYRWEKPPPADALQRAIGCPHLTWVFVSPWEVRRGVATALFAASVRELLALGYRQLASTFLLGNDPSTLWHWRLGFRLLPFHSAMRREVRERT